MGKILNRLAIAPILGLCMILSLGIGTIQMIGVNASISPRTADVTVMSPLWNVSFGMGQADRAEDVVSDERGNFYMTGFIVGPSLYQDVFLAKFDPMGELYSIKYWGGSSNDAGHSVALDDEGNVYVTGHTYSFGLGSNDIFVLKYSPEGDLLWNITWGGVSSDVGYHLEVTSDGRVYVCGQTYSYGAGSSDFAILKLGTDGELLWNRTFGGSNIDGAYGMCINKNNGVMISGYTGSWGAGDFDVCLVSYDKNGIFLWNNSWGGADGEFAISADIDSTGNYIVTGYAESFSAGDKNVLVMGINSSGSILWNTTWGGGNEDRSGDALVDLDGNIYVAGITNSFGQGGMDLALIKFSSSGALLWNTTWGGPSSDSGEGLVRTGNFIYVIGYSDSWSTENENIVVLCYDIPLPIDWMVIGVSVIVVAGIVLMITLLVRRKKQRK